MGGENSGNALEPSNALNYRAWGIPAVLSREIPGNALRAFSGSFRIFSRISSGKSQPYWGCGPNRAYRSIRQAPVRFGYDLEMERFKRFRFSVLAVPLRKGFFCISVQFNRKGRFRFRFRFLENGSGSAFGFGKNGSDGSGSGSGPVPEQPCSIQIDYRQTLLWGINFQLQIQKRAPRRRINFHDRDRSLGISVESLSLQIQTLS